MALLSAVVSAQDYTEPAPSPAFPAMEEMNEITQPTDEEKADFPLNVHWAGWAIWDDSENEDLAKWIETSNWSGMKDEEPCGWVIGADIDLTNAPND